MKTTDQEIRNELKKIVIMGNHPECETYEEAIKEDGREVVFDEREIVEYNKTQEAGVTLSVMAEFWLEKLIEHQFTRISKITRLHDELIIKEEVPITIGRIINAYNNKSKNKQFPDDFWYYQGSEDIFGEMLDNWIFSKEGKECTDDDQDIKMIKQLIKLFKETY